MKISMDIGNDDDEGSSLLEEDLNFEFDLLIEV